MKHEAVTAEFLSWLESEGYTISAEMPEGMWCAVRPLMFHYTLHIGVIGDRSGFEDRFCYANRPRAEAALLEWRERGFEGEPKGWRKHPATNRCRNDDGDPESGTIGWPARS